MANRKFCNNNNNTSRHYPKYEWNSKEVGGLCSGLTGSAIYEAGSHWLFEASNRELTLKYKSPIHQKYVKMRPIMLKPRLRRSLRYVHNQVQYALNKYPELTLSNSLLTALTTESVDLEYDNSLRNPYSGNLLASSNYHDSTVLAFPTGLTANQLQIVCLHAEENSEFVDISNTNTNKKTEDKTEWNYRPQTEFKTPLDQVEMHNLLPDRVLIGTRAFSQVQISVLSADCTKITDSTCMKFDRHNPMDMGFSPYNQSEMVLSFDDYSAYVWNYEANQKCCRLSRPIDLDHHFFKSSPYLVSACRFGSHPKHVVTATHQGFYIYDLRASNQTQQSMTNLPANQTLMAMDVFEPSKFMNVISTSDSSICFYDYRTLARPFLQFNNIHRHDVYDRISVLPDLINDTSVVSCYSPHKREVVLYPINFGDKYNNDTNQMARIDSDPILVKSFKHFAPFTQPYEFWKSSQLSTSFTGMRQGLFECEADLPRLDGISFIKNQKYVEFYQYSESGEVYTQKISFQFACDDDENEDGSNLGLEYTNPQSVVRRLPSKQLQKINDHATPQSFLFPEDHKYFRVLDFQRIFKKMICCLKIKKASSVSSSPLLDYQSMPTINQDDVNAVCSSYSFPLTLYEYMQIIGLSSTERHQYASSSSPSSWETIAMLQHYQCKQWNIVKDKRKGDNDTDNATDKFAHSYAELLQRLQLDYQHDQTLSTETIDGIQVAINLLATDIYLGSMVLPLASPTKDNEGENHVEATTTKLSTKNEIKMILEEYTELSKTSKQLSRIWDQDKTEILSKDNNHNDDYNQTNHHESKFYNSICNDDQYRQANEIWEYQPSQTSIIPEIKSIKPANQKKKPLVKLSAIPPLPEDNSKIINHNTITSHLLRDHTVPLTPTLPSSQPQLESSQSENAALQSLSQESNACFFSSQPSLRTNPISTISVSSSYTTTQTTATTHSQPVPTDNSRKRRKSMRRSGF